MPDLSGASYWWAVAEKAYRVHNATLDARTGFHRRPEFDELPGACRDAWIEACRDVAESIRDYPFPGDLTGPGGS